MKKLPKKLTLKITEDDIRLGVCGSPTMCMYAVALKRLNSAIAYVRVDINSITITYDQHYWHYAIPKLGVDSLIDFDSKKVSPADMVKNASIKLDLINVRAFTPRTPEQLEKERIAHKERSQRLRANPDYVKQVQKKPIRVRIQRILEKLLKE